MKQSKNGKEREKENKKKRKKFCKGKSSPCLEIQSVKMCVIQEVKQPTHLKNKRYYVATQAL